MSLVSLTFGDGKKMSYEAPIQVVRPFDKFKDNPNVENRLEVKKACVFYNHKELYIVGKIISGVVSEQMEGFINGTRFKVIELESKHAGPIAGAGMTIGLVIPHLEEGLIKNGDLVSFGSTQKIDELEEQFRKINVEQKIPEIEEIVEELEQETEISRPTVIASENLNEKLTPKHPEVTPLEIPNLSSIAETEISPRNTPSVN